VYSRPASSALDHRQAHPDSQRRPIIVTDRPQLFELSIAVEPGDIDDMQHVNNVVYLRWVQDVALAHWQSSATEEMQATLAWVATRHELDYLRAALPYDVVLARTWIGTVDSRRFERFTEIVRATDQCVLLRARTLWLLVTRATGRVTRISPELRACFPAVVGPPDGT
jgi:acyl-CoA thioester hydrolase